MDLLQKYLFIPLDIFAKSQQNKDIANKSDGWLTLFSSDEPDVIIGLLEKYPEFRDIYGEAYQICLNIEKVMEMFSEELYMLDRNTEKYMIDVMQNEFGQARNDLQEAKDSLAIKQNVLIETQNDLAEAKNDLDRMGEKYIQSVRNAVEIMRSMGLGEQEIMGRLCGQYQLGEGQAKEFL
ncbi:hypothetical protein IMSAGC019_03906 [Lachnospiraceae bacterium]|nr:hypothetical protein IMSAGC019_03906 [Lachnospiraceae bacterium]